MQARLRATATFVYEYEANTDNYKVGTVEEMCKIDEEVFLDDPGFLTNEAKLTVKVACIAKGIF